MYLYLKKLKYFIKNYNYHITMNNNRKLISDKDIKLFKFLIEHYNNNHSILKYENTQLLLWKDFLLHFKKCFSYNIQNIYTGKISDILRILLNIDQEKHVRSGIKLSFENWINFYK
jgi:hypothetical protein